MSSVRRFRRLQRVAIHPALSALFPTRCFGCGSWLGPVQLLGACPSCWAGLSPLLPPICPSCGIPVPAGTDLLGQGRGRCATCLLSGSTLAGVRAAVLYDALARRFLLRAKLAGRREILPHLGVQLSSVLGSSGFAAGCTLVTAVPSHPLQYLGRGFNPALEIARPVAEALGLPLARRVLVRRLFHGGTAKNLRARDRRRMVRAAFRARPTVRGHQVLLVDDVLTTGATLAACARCLLAAGAAQVRGAIWARTPSPTAPFD